MHFAVQPIASACTRAILLVFQAAAKLLINIFDGNESNRILRQQNADLRKRLAEIEIETRILEGRNASVWRHLFDKGEKKSSPGLSSAERISFRNMFHNICQVTHETGDLICAHIHPKEFGDELLTHNPDGPKNLLLLFAAVEEKFDSGEVCFLPETIPNSGVQVLKLRILNTEIRDDSIPGTCKTFGELEGSLLDVHYNFPSYSLLSKHARAALCKACLQGWVDRSEFVTLSELAEFWSPESHKVPVIQAWLKSHFRHNDISPGEEDIEAVGGGIFDEAIPRYEILCLLCAAVEMSGV